MKLKLIIIVFIFAVYIKPAGFDLLGYAAINQFFNISRIIVTLLVLYFYFKRFKGLSKFLKYECAYFLFLGLSTFLSEVGMDRFFIFSISIISLTMVIELLAKYNQMLLIKGLFIWYFILLAVNLAYMVSLFGFTINIEEAYPEYFAYDSDIIPTFLSSVNGVASYVFPALCCAILLMLITSKRNVWSWLLIGIAFVSELILWSATSLTGVFLILVYVLYVYEKKLQKYVKGSLLIGTSLAISLGVTFFNIQKFFSFIIVDILHKDLTMTGRTEVRNWGYEGFYSSPVWGCGVSATTIDNGFVQLLYMSGLVGTFFFALFMIYNYKGICHKRANGMEKFFSFVLAVVFLMFMSESWPQFFGLYVILALARNLKTVEGNVTFNRGV